MSGEKPAARREDLEAILRQRGSELLNRVELLDEAGSTQDAAFERAAGAPGLVLVASRQTAGRGRLGRSWVQREGLGIAATFVLDAEMFHAQRLSLAGGLAAARALDGRAEAFAEFGLRWPNDVVEPVPRPGGGRKVAGVLIEVRGGLALVGIGINVLQLEADFPPELAAKAVSLRQLRSTAQRPEVAAALLGAMIDALREDPAIAVQAWGRRDVLTGSDQEFIHDRLRIRGVVESIDPTHEVVLRTAPGSIIRLPAATTSLVHD